MIGATTKRASTGNRSWARRWTPALAGPGIIVLAVTACGSGGTTSAAAPAVSSSPAPASSPAAFPGVTGTAAAVSASSLEVQNPTSGHVTVTFTSATTITETVTAASTDVKAGSCVTVIGQPPASGAASGGSASRTVTATTVTISTPANGSCTGGFGGGGHPQGSFSPNPSFSPRPRPSGSRGAFGAGGGFGGANGKVTSLSASGFVVQGRNPAAGTDTSVTVTTSASTKYMKVVTAHWSALKTGQCITAVGSTNSIGAVAARTIQISQPGPNGCVTGFGGFRGGSGRPSSNA